MKTVTLLQATMFLMNAIFIEESNFKKLILQNKAHSWASNYLITFSGLFRIVPDFCCDEKEVLNDPLDFFLRSVPLWLSAPY